MGGFQGGHGKVDFTIWRCARAVQKHPQSEDHHLLVVNLCCQFVDRGQADTPPIGIACFPQPILIGHQIDGPPEDQLSRFLFVQFG